jgi:hypothetical protein
MKALVICAYMGPLPNYFALWLRSAAANPQVDFLLICDHPPSQPLPGNVSYKSTELEQLRQLWSEMAGFPVALNSPYKLNDFKPLFWRLADDLNRYDYWGYCDLDLLFGDLAPLLERTLGRFDMILSEGHLRFLRNDARTRNAWREIIAPRRWQDVLADPANFGMDEHHGINRVFAWPDRSWFANSGMIADIDPNFRQLRLLPCFKNPAVQAFFWDNGKLFRERYQDGRYWRDEFLYIHLQKRRMTLDPACLDSISIDIGPDGFHPRLTAEPDRRTVLNSNPWYLPNLPEMRILVREGLRRGLGKPSPFVSAGAVSG